MHGRNIAVSVPSIIDNCFPSVDLLIIRSDGCVFPLHTLLTRENQCTQLR